jgi:hypothetical protein
MSNEELYTLLNDRFEGWELVDLLGLSAEEICLAFQDEVNRKMNELKEILGLDEGYGDDDDEEDDYDELDYS